jgi:hypothetical protein
MTPRNQVCILKLRPLLAGKIESGRGQPHSKTCRNVRARGLARQRPGVRPSSAALAFVDCMVVPSPCRHDSTNVW